MKPFKDFTDALIIDEADAADELAAFNKLMLDCYKTSRQAQPATRLQPGTKKQKPHTTTKGIMK